MRVNYKGKFMCQLGDWRRSDISVRDAILELVEAAADDPFHGIGDPHLVKELGRGVWARHIVDHHFLIYILERGSVTMFSCRAIGDE